ncbi:hypothetical protein MJO29_004175 [Puccinia striiformis f. sp. tritici]|uniref:Uncharacterized protein n=1 Tax=Puccinia striiformis TaxID=27350 RepID=A0A2S4VR37_9BASI|nr:hypothetical protein MJO29_004175 [Puccinia striiformis f. sp. tritici]KAI9626925.1 hypothetical protein KEM48_010108 [Puccinia striiformis f. sp. tritici PST-130]POW11991.1 hypothetical protein PSTT_04837 [Puccinia striiformis]
MFWNKTTSSSSDEQPEPHSNHNQNEGLSSSTTEEGVTRSEGELKKKIDHEQLFQRVNSKISGNEPLSCMKSFDKLLGCYSVSSQIKSIYRFGDLDYDRCKISFNDFKFCLNTKYNFDNSDPENDQQSLRWNLRKSEKIFEGPNSQDVWDARPIEPLEPTLFK